MAPSVTHPSATGDFLVSLTRLQLRSSLYLPHFFWHTWRSVRQIKHIKGFRGGRLARDASGAYWTVTVWEDLAAMRDFRNTGAHMTAMPKLLHWCNEASVARWQQEHAGLPDGAEMLEKMRALGRVSKVSRPTAEHVAGSTAGSTAPVPGPRFSPAG